MSGARPIDAPATRARGLRISLRGILQGVGFRPFVHRLAGEEGVSGWVRNTGSGVEIEVEGEPARLDAFTRRLRAEAPPLARIRAVRSRSVGPSGAEGFAIRPSRSRRGDYQPVAPDAATCDDCLAEVLDPTARRHGYPFTNCTRCGPRFTIIVNLPYDRERTTMRRFRQCGHCRSEYEDPSDRRFHAEPIACAECGPRLELRPDSAEADMIGRAAAALRDGSIVALKGLGGFQLACSAEDAAAVLRLRRRKNRDAKPFAVMVPDLEMAHYLCLVSEAEAAVLGGPRAPIVLLHRRPRAGGIADAVAPRLRTLGLMLPYTPLHHLLMRAYRRPLVMTSGNRGGEPIAYRNEDAESKLGDVADLLLSHDRDIAAAYDDSVVRFDDAGQQTVIRRARGYAPEPIQLPLHAPVPILATGAQLKSAICVVRDDTAFLSQHIGDMDDAATLAHFFETVDLYERLFRIEPRVVAHDLHPDYAATRYAHGLDDVELIGVQHHHAHIVSCMAEHGRVEPVIGVALDGAGYGPDGTVWGGEVLACDWAGYRRVARLAPLPLPGGDAAAREPWRMALAALARAFDDEQADLLAAELLGDIDGHRRKAVLHLARAARGTPLTSSAGRLFDAVSALAGICQVNRCEGQAAMELEAAANDDADAYPLPLRTAADDDPGAFTLPLRAAAAHLHGTGPLPVWAAVERRAAVNRFPLEVDSGEDPGEDPIPPEPAVLDTPELIRALVADRLGGIDAARISARFHNGLANGLLAGCAAARDAHDLDTVALSGGCFQNARLTRLIRRRLCGAGFQVLTHHLVPPNDGGIAVGQAAVALARSALND